VNYLAAEQVLFIHASLIVEIGGEHGMLDHSTGQVLVVGDIGLLLITAAAG
jgi:hypothetical protein